MANKNVLFLLADGGQYDDYLELRQNIEAKSKATLNVLDLQDAKDEAAQRRLLNECVVVIICSNALTGCVNDRSTVDVDCDGMKVKLYGGALNDAFQCDAVRSRMLLLSLCDGCESAPKVLDGVEEDGRLYVCEDEDALVSDTFASKMVGAIRGLAGN